MWLSHSRKRENGGKFGLRPPLALRRLSLETGYRPLSFAALTAPHPKRKGSPGEPDDPKALSAALVGATANETEPPTLREHAPRIAMIRLMSRRQLRQVTMRHWITSFRMLLGIKLCTSLHSRATVLLCRSKQIMSRRPGAMSGRAASTAPSGIAETRIPRPRPSPEPGPSCHSSRSPW